MALCLSYSIFWNSPSPFWPEATPDSTLDVSLSCSCWRHIHWTYNLSATVTNFESHEPSYFCWLIWALHRWPRSPLSPLRICCPASRVFSALLPRGRMAGRCTCRPFEAVSLYFHFHYPWMTRHVMTSVLVPVQLPLSEHTKLSDFLTHLELVNTQPLSSQLVFACPKQLIWKNKCS